MNQPSSTPSSRPNLTSVVAACILSGGLITAAIINSHKNASPSLVSVVSASGQTISRPVLSTPPFSKDIISAQITAQLMAAPQLRGVQSDGYGSPVKEANGKWCSLTGVTTRLIEYSAKDDTFAVTVDMTWQPEGGAAFVNPDAFVLHNDGYGQYIASYLMASTKSKTSKNIPEVLLRVQ